MQTHLVTGWSSPEQNQSRINSRSVPIPVNCLKKSIASQPKNQWTGAVDNNRETPGNWSCGTVPDINTDVVTGSGTVVINANTSIRTLYLSPGVSFTISPGVTLLITH